MTGRAQEHGFTLIELLVSMALAVVVFGATLSALDVFQTNNRLDLVRNETQDSARTAIDRLAVELRNIAAPSTGAAGALEQSGSYSLTFQTIDSQAPKAGSKNATNAMRVRYCLNNTSPSNEVLWKQFQRWTEATAPALPSSTACPDLTAGDWEGSTRLVEHVTNRNGGQKRKLFLYGPPGASEVSQITSIEPRLYLDVNPGKRPGETQLSSTISLRNANRVPLAAFTAKEVNGHVLLNASESTDPDGLALTFKWTEGSEVAGKEEGATVLPSTAQQYETPLLVSKSTYSFWLKVTDPGGLTASTKKTVTMK